jgi:hypothetical protein
VGKTEKRPRTDANPFTDVDPWAVRYVAWAYAGGLTKGLSATEFGAHDSASARMFATFVLRALGYDDSAGDFTYETALSMAGDLGLIPAGAYDGKTDFYRDDCVRLCYAALKMR